MKTKIGIYSNDRDRAIEKAEELLGENGEDVIKKVKSIHQYVVETESFSITVCPANESSRGCKFHKVYVSKDVEEKFINMVMLQSIMWNGLDYKKRINYF